MKNGTLNTQSRHTRRTVTKHNPQRSDSVVIQITTTKPLVELLDQIVRTGFFGTSRAAAAERLLAEALRVQLREGTIQKRNKVFEV